jgi:tetratricopeptide (TPR) repeat protein
MLAFPGDSEFRVKAMVGQGALARLMLVAGNLDRAVAEARTGLKLAHEVVAAGPDNTQWAERAALVHLVASDVLLARGELDASAGEARIARDMVDRLVEKDPSAVRWSEDLRRRCLLLEMRIEFARGSAATTLVLADQVVANVRASKTPTFRRAFDLALAQLFAGQALKRLGKPDEAQQRWQSALAEWPLRPTAMPEDLAVRALLLRRLGKDADAQVLAGKLAHTGYRHPLFVRAMQGGV